MSTRCSRAGLLRRSILGVLVAGLLAVLASPAAPAGPPPCAYQGVERVVAVGDVHGAYDRYVEILRTAGVLDDHRHWIGGHTHLVQVGDMIDRGADSRKVLDLLRDLEKEARRAGGAVHVLLGNHEIMRMLGDLRYVSAGEYEAFATSESIGIRTRYLERLTAEERAALPAELPLGFLEMRVAFGRNGEYGSWLRELDTVININGVLFVHGGLSPEVAQKPCNVINDTVRRELTSDIDKTRAAPLKSLAASPTGPLWYRGLSEESDAFLPELEKILSAQGAKAIVVGHTIQRDGRIQKRFGGRVFALDTGMQPAYVPTGRASALEIKNGVFTAIYTDRRDVLLDTTKEVVGKVNQPPTAIGGHAPTSTTSREGGVSAPPAT